MIRNAMLTVLAAIFTYSAGNARALAKQNACEREMARAAEKHGVPIGVLYAVGLTETGRGDTLRPYALNIEGRAIYDIDKQSALRAFDAARKAGAKLIDIGCMQINHHFHRRHFATLEDMFDPVKNVDYAAKFLSQLKAREGTWTMAVARYYAGPNNDSGQRRYVCRVITNMVASGFGQWTQDARSFCHPGKSQLTN
ncbi:MAG: lytic transglycosylase domain-containing protein [Hyphomicrobiaceae bacterium]|nr:MAG: lytic transglycosylase domain-containing protein [Hyphomicrobiaceae bacterium]